MLCAPDQEFQQYRRQVDSFFREPVFFLPPVRWIAFGLYNSRSAQSTQPVRENIRRNPFPGVFEVSERAEAAYHQISHDQQRPPIPKDLQ